MGGSELSLTTEKIVSYIGFTPSKFPIRDSYLFSKIAPPCQRGLAKAGILSRIFVFILLGWAAKGINFPC